jgi:ABC-type multidrug transport system ATPase subunit
VNAKRGLIERASSSEERVTSLELHSVSLKYPAATALTPERLSLRLTRGGTVLVGPNGCGKSSAILLALGFVPPTSGSVTVNGDALTAEKALWLRSRVGYVTQRSYVVPTESLAWHATLGGASDLAAVRDACTLMGLDPRLGGAGRELETKIGSLSGGERQRFLIARALARRADVLILDEPEVGLDSHGRELLRTILEREATERIVLLIAHDASVAPESFRQISCIKPRTETAIEAVLA